MATTKKSTQETKETKKKTTTAATKTPAKAAAKTTATKKAATTKTTTKKEAAKKTTTAKTTAKKPAAKTTKKPVTKKETEDKKKLTQTKVNNEGFSVKGKNEIDDLLGALSVTDHEEPTPAPKQPTKKSTAKTGTKKSEETGKASTSKKPKPSEIKRPERKARTFNKEEKVLYKRLEEAFNYVANLTMVIEERLLDKKVISDLTLGEIHVLEVVDKEAVMPMTKIANELKITVGSLTTCVNRLVKKEYLFRERDQEDHRVMKISTTQKAKKVLKIHDRFHEDILYGILDGVTIRDATKVMTQVARTLENYYNPKEKNYEKPIDKKKKKNI